MKYKINKKFLYSFLEVKPQIVTKSTDFNSLETGMYYMNTWIGSGKKEDNHFPATQKIGILLVYKDFYQNEEQRIQVAFCELGKIYVRYEAGTYSRNWYEYTGTELK